MKMKISAILLICLTHLSNTYGQHTDKETFGKPISRTTYKSITTPDQIMWYMNGQHLINTWNNLIIDAKTGKEQLRLMNESGVFAEDIKLTFNFFGQESHYTGLVEEPLEFYNGFVNTLKKKRTNIASNFEVVEFTKDYMVMNFKHFIFFNETLSLVGQNQVIIKLKKDKFYIAAAYIDVRLANLEHGY